MTSARPITPSTDTVPWKASLRWKRESAELDRWSPITKTLPIGTLTSNLSFDGGFPGCRYGSSRGTPLTVTLPLVSQHFTVSPPTPITRLIRSCSSFEGSSPMKVSPSLSCLTPTGSSPVCCSSGGSQWPGSLKTTTSPRCGCQPNQGVSLSTSTRSPIRIVSSIEPEGITKACTRKVLSTRAISSATTISSGTSFTADLRRRRLTRRASFRRSARVGRDLTPVVRVPVGSLSSPSCSVRVRPRLPMRATGCRHLREGSGRGQR